MFLLVLFEFEFVLGLFYAGFESLLIALSVCTITNTDPLLLSLFPNVRLIILSVKCITLIIIHWPI